MKNTCIVVLGMHRSGTSLAAGILQRLGVSMGTTFRAPDRHNSTGYYEDLDFRDWNKAIVNRAGGRWFNPPNPEDVTDAVEFYSDRIDNLLATKKGLWGFKDPRTVFTIHALEEYLPVDTRFIRVSRNPLDVVASLSKRAAIKGYKRTDAHWYSIISRYGDRLQTYLSDTMRPVLAVKYEDLMVPKDAKGVVERMAHFCDLEWRDEELVEHAMNLIVFGE